MTTLLAGRKAFWREKEWEVEAETKGDLKLRGADGECVLVARNAVELLPDAAEEERARTREAIRVLEGRIRSFRGDVALVEHELRDLRFEVNRLEKSAEGRRLAIAEAECEIQALNAKLTTEAQK